MAEETGEGPEIEELVEEIEKVLPPSLIKLMTDLTSAYQSGHEALGQLGQTPAGWKLQNCMARVSESLHWAEQAVTVVAARAQAEQEAKVSDES